MADDNRYGYTSISLKSDARATLTQWQLYVQHKLRRRVNQSDALLMALALAYANVESQDVNEAYKNMINSAKEEQG
jgi:hypothetical protein